jgi:hypothetical protein
MCEFDAYNMETQEWETFSISQYAKIIQNKKYENIVINQEDFI